MGNALGKISTNSSEPDLKSYGNHQKRVVTVSGNISEQTSFEVSISDLALQSRSGCTSFSSLKSDSSHSIFTRPWKTVSRKKSNNKGSTTDFGLSKTIWPVPFFESLFLPEFRIRDKVNEDSFTIIKVISSGAFSKVYKVVKKDDGGIYAMKVLSKAQLVASNLINQVKEEVHIQRVVSHNPFIVNCPYHWQSRKQLFIISEYISGGELFKLLEDKGSLPLEILKLYLAELAIALDFLHNAGIIYRDLKLENILLNGKGHIQLIDFGLSKWLKYGSRTNTICGTLQYIAPEILQGKPYGHAVDWWSLGIVLVYMSSGRILHKKNRHRRRPFSIEEKIRDGRRPGTPTGATTTGETTEDRCCRICFDDKKKETAITPCRCKGTIGLVHMSCLEKWLSMSNTHSCELCGYNYETLRTPKYRVLYSIYYWVFLDRNPQYHRGLKSDFIVFIVLTPIALIGIYACIVAADFYSKEPSKYSPASRWTTISLLIMVVLLTFAYYLWVAVTMRFHMRIWYIWWQANNIVKVMPRDPNSNSLERVPLSGQSSVSRHSGRWSVREAIESRTNSLREVQMSTPTTQELSVDNHPTVIHP